MPTEEEIAALTARWPDARVKILCQEGHLLSDELQDGNSFRSAQVNLGGRVVSTSANGAGAVRIGDLNLTPSEGHR